MRDTLARFYAQQGKKQKQLLAAGFKNVRIKKPQYPATSNELPATNHQQQATFFLGNLVSWR
jgi:hypothetical protein